MPRTDRVIERTAKVIGYLEQLLANAEAEEFTITQPIKNDIEVLFETHVWGFRELLLLIVVARILDANYFPSQDLYACNPRALYEGPIRQVLEMHGIPSRQSGPLNVAKGITRLNNQWADGRRPSEVAHKLLDIISYVEQMDNEALLNFGSSLIARFLQEANEVQNLHVEASPKSDAEKLQMMCRRLIAETPDIGNTPQRIIGYLLEAYHEDIASTVAIAGHTDRASTTSTTSKKLGDITETLVPDHPFLVYEVTVKQFGPQRVREAYEAARAYDNEHAHQTHEIIVICRMNDVHPEASRTIDSNLYLGQLEYQDMLFYFLDIYEWIAGQLLRMTPEARVGFYNKLHGYISEANTAQSVKVLWGALHI